MPPCELRLESHVRYFTKCLEELPSPYTSLDTNRLTVAYFCVSGLDMLRALHKVDRPALVRWVYAQQLVPSADGGDSGGWAGGFRGAGYVGAPFIEGGAPPTCSLDTGHIAHTYTALALLVMLGDDLRGVHCEATLRHVRRLQSADGSFRAYEGGEADMRFVFCAAAICTLLRDGAPPSFIQSSIPTRAEYNAWLARRGVGVGGPPAS